MRSKAPELRLYHVKVNRAYANLSPHPTLLLPSTQPIDRDVGAKTKLADFGVPKRGRKRVETPAAVQRHLTSLCVVVSRRDAVANDS